MQASIANCLKIYSVKLCTLHFAKLHIVALTSDNFVPGHARSPKGWTLQMLNLSLPLCCTKSCVSILHSSKMLKECCKEEKDSQNFGNFFFFFFGSEMKNSDVQSCNIWVGQRGVEEQG